MDSDLGDLVREYIQPTCSRDRQSEVADNVASRMLYS
jgi:hypothetical protein